MKKKILHILPTLNLYGGTPSKIKKLINKSKHKHIIYVPYHYESFENYRKFLKIFKRENIAVIEGVNKNFIHKIIVLLKIIKSEKINIIHVYFNKEVIIALGVKILNPSIRIISSFVGSANPSNKILALFLTWAYKKIDYSIFISKYVKQSKTNFFPILEKIPNKIIYNGVDINYYGIENERLYEDYIVTVSGLNIYKNLFVLIDAMDIIVNKEHRDIKLLIVGDGPLRNDLEAAIGQKHLKQNVLLLGYMDKIESIVKSSLFYVHPADREGFGIAVAEAMLLKKAVILSDSGGLPELIENNKSGILVNAYNPTKWAQAIIYLADNPEERNRMAKFAYQRAVKKFSIMQFVENHDNVYSKI